MRSPPPLYHALFALALPLTVLLCPGTAWLWSCSVYAFSGSGIRLTLTSPSKFAFWPIWTCPGLLLFNFALFLPHGSWPCLFDLAWSWPWICHFPSPFTFLLLPCHSLFYHDLCVTSSPQPLDICMILLSTASRCLRRVLVMSIDLPHYKPWSHHVELNLVLPYAILVLFHALCC